MASPEKCFWKVKMKKRQVEKRTMPFLYRKNTKTCFKNILIFSKLWIYFVLLLPFLYTFLLLYYTFKSVFFTTSLSSNAWRPLFWPSSIVTVVSKSFYSKSFFTSLHTGILVASKWNLQKQLPRVTRRNIAVSRQNRRKDKKKGEGSVEKREKRKTRYVRRSTKHFYDEFLCFLRKDDTRCRFGRFNEPRTNGYPKPPVVIVWVTVNRASGSITEPGSHTNGQRVCVGQKFGCIALVPSTCYYRPLLHRAEEKIYFLKNAVTLYKGGSFNGNKKQPNFFCIIWVYRWIKISFGIIRLHIYSSSINSPHRPEGIRGDDRILPSRLAERKRRSSISTID